MSAIHYEEGDSKENEVEPIKEIVRRLPSHCLVCTNVYTTLEYKNGRPVRPEIDVLIFGKKVYLIDLANHRSPFIQANGWETGGKIEKCKRDKIEDWTKSLKGKFQKWCKKNEVSEASFRNVRFEGYVALTNRSARPRFASGQEIKKKQVKKLAEVLTEIVSNEVTPGPTDLEIIKKYVDAEIAPVRDNSELPPSRQDLEVSIEKAAEFWDEGWLSENGTRLFRFRKHKVYNSNELNREKAESCLERLGALKDDHNISHKSIVVFDIEEIDPAEDIIWHLFKVQEGDQRVFDWNSGDVNRGIQERLKVVRGLLEALVVIHEAGIVHRNINHKSAWVRTEDGSPYLTDFELGFSPGPSRVTVGVQQYSDMKWWAPEAFNEPELLREPASDCFSFGLLCSFILSGRDLPDEELRMRGEWIPDIPQDLDAEYPGLQGWLQKLCLVNPAQRATAVDSLNALERILGRPTPTHRIGDLDPGVLIENRYRITGFPESSHSPHFRIAYARDESLTRDVVLKFAVDDDSATVELQKENDCIEGLRQVSNSGDVSGLLLPDMEARISRNIETGNHFVVRKFWPSDLEDTSPLKFSVWFECTKILLSGLAELGELGWSIRDITPKNVIISDGKPVLIDVGSALPLQEVEGRGDGFEGNAEYLPHYLLANNEPNALLAEMRKNLLPRDLFAALMTSYFWLERRHPWAALRADESTDPRKIVREDLSVEQRRSLDAFFKRWLGPTSFESWKRHQIKVTDVLDDFTELEVFPTAVSSWVINEEGYILGLKTDKGPLAEPREGELTSVEAIDSEGRPHSIYFCKLGDEESSAQLTDRLNGLRKLKTTGVEAWEFDEQIRGSVRYLRIKRDEEYPSTQDEVDLEVVCREILKSLDLLQEKGQDKEQLEFTLHGPRPIWVPSVLASADGVRGLEAVIAVLKRQFPDVEIPQCDGDGHEFVEWLQEQSEPANSIAQTSWEDDYNEMQWKDVGEFFQNHLFNQTGPFSEIGWSSSDRDIGKGRSGTVYRVIPNREESLVVKIVNSRDISKTEWVREGERILEALRLPSENLARPQTPNIEFPGFFVFFAINGNTLKKNWAANYFHEPNILASKALKFSSSVHQLSDRYGLHCTDLHPSNIIVSSDSDEWVLIDYGEGYGRNFTPPELRPGVLLEEQRCMVFSLALILLEELLRPVEKDDLLHHHRKTEGGQDFTTGDSLFGSESGICELNPVEYWEEMKLAIQRRLEQTNSYGQAGCEGIASEVRDVFKVALDPDPQKRYPNIWKFTGGLNDLLSYR